MAVKIDLDRKKVSLGVSDLVLESLAIVGRVAGLSVWTRLALGREAHAQHQTAQADRHAGYAREVFVRYRTTVDEFAVVIQGRLDGVYPPRDGEPWVVEEIKSVVMLPLQFAALDSRSYPHYVEQLRLYCFFLNQEQKPALGRLVFLNLADGERRDIELAGPFDDCAALIAERIRILIGRAREQLRSREDRRLLAGQLVFPHAQPRRHQDTMIAAVERALDTGRHLLVSAPSGIGKTAGALYPVLRHALANDRRVFFVTAKNTQQQIAWETLRKMNVPSAVMFRAREQMCINQVYACREEYCPHLQMFRPKLDRTQVLERLLGQRLVAPEAMMDAGRGASLCPFELALLGAERTDVVVCDYNYVFDPQVYFRRFFQDTDYSDTVLVIDEAHNLMQRAMDYYSPVLRRRQVHALQIHVRHLESSLAREFRKFLGLIDEFFESHQAHRTVEYSQVEDLPAETAKQFLIDSPRAYFEELRPLFNKLAVRYVLDKLQHGRVIPDDPIEEFFAEFGKFCSVLAMAGEEFAYIFDQTDGESVKILCKDPSRPLGQRLEGFHSVIAMSATLEPMEFYRQLLGLDPERTDSVVLPSPFPAKNRGIFVVRNVITTYQRRQSNYGKIADVIVTTANSKPGNYMALFPSYEFLKGVAQQLGGGRWEVVIQEPKMTDEQRQQVVESLKTTDPPKLVLAVQGGLFAEGVDYPGEQLSGVIVISPALPQVNFERDIIQRHYQARSGQGFEFAYLYPGMNRVIQAVGRLIRSETDCGVAVLVCQRFVQTQYSALFPADWSDSEIRAVRADDLGVEIGSFWNKLRKNRAG